MKLTDLGFFEKHGVQSTVVLTSFVRWRGNINLMSVQLSVDGSDIPEMLVDLGIKYERKH